MRRGAQLREVGRPAQEVVPAGPGCLRTPRAPANGAKLGGDGVDGRCRRSRLGRPFAGAPSKVKDDGPPSDRKPWSAASPALWWLELGRRQVIRCVDRTTDVRRISSIFRGALGSTSPTSTCFSNMAAEKAHNNQAASSASQDGRNLPRLLPGHAANRPAHQGRAACKLQRRRLQVFFINICARSLDIHQADNMEQHYSAASARTTRSRSPADAAAARPMCACERARTARMPSGCMPWCPLPKQTVHRCASMSGYGPSPAAHA